MFRCDTARDTTCETRLGALRDGSMRYVRPGGGVRSGWCFPVDTYHGAAVKLPVFRWDFCPFCDGSLPHVVRAKAAPEWTEDGG